MERGEMSEEQQNGQQNSGEDPGSQVYSPPEEFTNNANIQDPEIWK